MSCDQDDNIQVYRLAKQRSSPNHVESGKIAWSTPREWVEQPASGMRTGSFLAKGPEGQEVDISVIYLAGDAGGDLANVNRWRGQISLSSWTAEELLRNQNTIDTPLGKATIVDFSNEDENIRMIVAIVPYQEGTWFFKMLGEKELVERQQPIFHQFLQSVHSL